MRQAGQLIEAPGDRIASRQARPLRTSTAHIPRLVMIGASTGGPQALVELLGALEPALPLVSVTVALHMPPDLMPLIAAHVSRTCGMKTHVVQERVPLARGLVYFAPGNRHLGFVRGGVTMEIMPTTAPLRDVCKPAVDVMFASGAAAIGPQALGIVLSGMGTDGLDGARAIVEAGGSVIVQSRETSAVWGMPGSVVKADLASAVLSPAALGRELLRRLHLDEVRA